ncbi:hypothetical protein [Rossellomorea marisflavi]|uniref:hypothetical protein n=1 Tax=Rossellomorea marisflavi TaxID=189381 RepID=UPI003FA18BBA
METAVMIASELTMDEAKDFSMEFYHIDKNWLHRAIESNESFESDTSMYSKYDTDISGNSQIQWHDNELIWNLYACVSKEGKNEVIFFNFTRRQEVSRLYISSEEHPTPQLVDVASFRAFKQMEELLQGFGY